MPRSHDTVTCPCWAGALTTALGRRLGSPEDLVDLLDEAFPDPHPQIVAFLFDDGRRVVGVVPVAAHWLPEARKPWHDLLDEMELRDSAFVALVSLRGSNSRLPDDLEVGKYGEVSLTMCRVGRPLIDWIIRWPDRWVSLASPRPRRPDGSAVSMN